MKRRVERVSVRRSGRGAMGNVLVEGVSATTLLAFVAVPFLYFFGNMAAQLILQAQVAAIANRAAEACDEGRYWLGQPRPGFLDTDAEDKAKQTARALCRRVGLNVEDVKVTLEHTFDADITTCDVKVAAAERIPFHANVFGFNMASLFPGKVSARGVSLHAVIKPYALISWDAPTKEDESYTRPLGLNQRDVAVVPVYGFFYNATGEARNTHTVGYGMGLAPDLLPENFFSMNHYFLKKTDIDAALAGPDDVAISGWNRARVIDGRDVVFSN